ncbi:hypothetical protein LUZ60_007026 [Juncus effusus]|nr:hypothetical protein LUZ60_007026 [Juncus effusus]
MTSSGATRQFLRRRLSTVGAPSTTIPSSTISTIRLLARKRQFAEITSLISPYLSSPALPDPLFSRIVSLLSSSGMVSEAVSAISAHPTPSTASLNALLSPLNRNSVSISHKIPDLFKSLTTSQSIAPDQTTYGILIKSLCLSPSGAESAIRVLKQMEEKNIPANAIIYTTIMDSFYKEKKPTRAEKIWNEMCEKGIKPDLAAYNVKIMHNATQGKTEGIKKLIDEMGLVGLKPDVFTYSYLIKSHCKYGEFDEAMEVYKGLEENGCKPNNMIYQHFVADMCKKERFEDARMVFDDGIKRGKVPDLGTVRVLVKGLRKDNKIRAAKRVVTGLRHRFPEEFVGNWKELEKLVGLGENGEETEGDDERKLETAA